MKSLTQLKAESKPETLLRKREKADEERVYSMIATEREELENRKRARTPSVRTAASYIAGERSKQKNLKALNVRLKKNKDDLPNEGVFLVVKIQISVHAANPIKKALHALRLNSRYSAVLVNLNPLVKELLKIVEPFVVFGPVSKEVIEKLVRKRGKVLKQGVEVELKDNTYVESQLESFGILCIEDLIYELANGTSNFEKASSFLCPFKLNLPGKKFKKNAFAKGGDFGNRGDLDLIVDSMI